MLKKIGLLGLFLYAGTSALATPVPEIAAKYTESQLNFVYPPHHIASLCGNEMFGIESRSSAVSRSAWVCVKQDAVSGKMDVTDWGYLDPNLGRIIRNPVATDRNFILADGTNFYAFDPATLQQTVIGALSPSTQSVGSGMVFELMPEKSYEALLETDSGWEVRTFPAGALVFTKNAAARVIAGNFLSSQSTQLVQVGNNTFDIYDAHDDHFVKSVTTSQNIVQAMGAYDWTGAGQDSLYYGDLYDRLASVNLSTDKTEAVGSLNDFQLYGSTPIVWTGSANALAGLWYDAVRVFDPLTGTVLYSEPLPTDYNSYSTLTSWATDFNSDGKQDLLWVTFGKNLYDLPNGGKTTFLQSASGGYQVAGTTGPALDVLVTGDTYLSADSNVASHLDIVVRDPNTLQELWRRSDPAPVDSQVFLGQFGAGTDPVVITADENRIAAETLTDGQPLWQINNDEFTNGNGWDAFAVPASNCVGAACKRLLIASVAKTTASTGSFQEVVDTTTGNVMWSSAPDGCLGCGGTTLIAFADITGDGVPDILRLLPYQDNPQFAGILQALDGVTFQELWRAQITALSSDAIAISVASVGAPNVGVWTGQSLMLLSGADGHTIATLPTAAPVGYYYSSLHFAAFGPSEGVWVLSTGTTDFEWAPADLDRPTQSLPVPAMRSMAGENGGVLFAAGPEGIFRVQIPTDHLFANGFEP